MRRLLPLAHLMVSVLAAVTLIHIQCSVLAGSSLKLLQIDLLAIYVFYVGLEHHTFGALLKIVLVSLLFELLSAEPAGFSLMAHLLMMFAGNRLAVWLEMEQRVAQLALFAFLLLLKETLFTLTVGALDPTADVIALVLGRVWGFFATVVVAVPVMEILAWLDARFEDRRNAYASGLNPSVP